ncbi:hypothetical protein HYT04_01480 [Candidatus Kaiserbacteria bacterium]|nr:hypothetical protein [Candidatus Kaiserbacteria bacterium]
MSYILRNNKEVLIISIISISLSIFFAFFFLFFLTGIAFEQEADATAAEDIAAITQGGVTPQSPLYATDRFFERVGLFFAFNRSARAAQLTAIAEERLSEARALSEDDDERAEVLVEEYETTLERASLEAELSGNETTEARFSEQVARHFSVLDRVAEQVPEQARESIVAARERSVENHIAVMRTLAEKNPERAAEVFAGVAERRANATARKADDEGEDEAERAREINARAEEFGKYAEFGEEISLIAQGLRTGETTVKNLVDRATAQHIQVLEDVRARVPVEALQGIDSALQNARRVQGVIPGALSDIQIEERIEARRGEAADRREEAIQRIQENGGKVPAPVRSPLLDRARESAPQDTGARTAPSPSGIRNEQDALREATQQVEQQQGKSDAGGTLRGLPTPARGI